MRQLIRDAREPIDESKNFCALGRAVNESKRLQERLGFSRSKLNRARRKHPLRTYRHSVLPISGMHQRSALTPLSAQWVLTR